MEKPFIDLSGYPQASIQQDGDWSEPLVGGVGCNFFLGRKGNAPPWTNRALWDGFAGAMRDLSVGMFRVGFLPPNSGDIADAADIVSPWDDSLRRYDYQHDFFKAVVFLNEIARELDFPIMIDPWWPPKSMQVPAPGGVGKWRGAPADPVSYARDYVLPLVKHIVHDRRCEKVAWLGLLNEPVWKANDRDPNDFGVEENADQLVRMTEMYAAVRATLDAEGFERIGLVGPSALCSYQFPMADFLASGADPTPHLAAFDHHCYFAHLDNLPPPNEDFFSTHEMVDGAVRRWCDFSARQHKPFFITEMGSFAYGRFFWGERDMDGAASHTCVLSDAQFIVRSLARGAQALLRWTFSVPGRYDGRWSLVEWDERGVHPSPHVYPIYRELMRAARPGSRIMRIKTGHAAGRRCPVHAVATEKAGELSVLLVNDQPGLHQDVIFGPGPWKGRTLRRVVVDETRKGAELDPVAFTGDEKTGTELLLTPYSLTALTTRKS